MTPAELSEKLAELEGLMEVHEKRMEFLFDLIVGLRDKQTDPELHESLNSMKYVLSGRPAIVHASIPLLRAAAQALREQGERVKVLEEALKKADGTITALENCGVRAPCAQCDNHIMHGHKAARRALQGGDT